jgi:hypothetical protein
MVNFMVKKNWRTQSGYFVHRAKALYSIFSCNSIQLRMSKIHMTYITDSENDVNGEDQHGMSDDEPEDMRDLNADMDKAWERSVWGGGSDLEEEVSRRKPRRQASKTAATKTAGSASQMLKRSMMAADLKEPSAKKHKVSVAESKARVATKSLLEQLQESRTPANQLFWRHGK